MDLAESAIAGDRRALARLITAVENDTPTGRQALAALWPHTGRAHIVGVTGPSGSGKSTLVSEIAKFVRASSREAGRKQSHEAGGEQPREAGGMSGKVAIIAVDPTSPFTGGAILGDRIRMRDLSGDSGVFIRSMATRGTLGGLARATADVTDALDAAGFDLILIETVGAGQSEVEIARTAQTVIVVEAPGLGDDVQAAKAGILEIADILVVNKADQPGADAAVRALRHMLEFGSQKRELSGWEPLVLSATATEGKGIEAVVAAAARHRAHLQASGGLAARDRERAAGNLRRLLGDRLLAAWQAEHTNGQFEAAVERVAGRQSDAHSEAERLASSTKA